MLHLIATFTLLICLPALAATPDLPKKQIMDQIRGFYIWATKNGAQTIEFEPSIKEVPGTTKFYLDTSTLEPFTARFMCSGYFAPDFPGAISRYYNQHKANFATLSQKEFDEIARDGRGPMMETEDMDIFFCVQEYKYTKQFVQGMKIKFISFSDTTAKIIVESLSNGKRRLTSPVSAIDGSFPAIAYINNIRCFHRTLHHL